MARITPPTQQTDVSQLNDHEPYRVFIKKTDFEASSPEYGGENRLVIDWAFTEDPDFTVRDWVSLRLGRQQSGQVSKLRAILNALAHKHKAEEIAWFDDDTLEWSYDGDHVAARLTEGLEVVIRGEVVEKPSENGPKRRFKINVYSPAADDKPASGTRGRVRPEEFTTSAAQAAAGRRRRPADEDDDEAPF